MQDTDRAIQVCRFKDACGKS